MEKKYKLTEESIYRFGKTIYRIEALKDFGNVKKGDKGGYVESENNLSQKGNCWVYDNAQVYGNALVSGNALIYDNALVGGNALVYDNAKVCGNAQVFGNVQVFDSAYVCDNALVADVARVYGNASVYDNALVGGNALVYDNAKVFGKAKVYDTALVCGNAQICGSAEIKNSSDYIVFKNWWSSGRYFTWIRSNNMWRVGCFYGTGEELIKKAYEDSELSGREYKRVVDYVESILRDNK